MALIAFSGDFGDAMHMNDPESGIILDPDRAGAELRQAGFAVTFMPDCYAERLCHPLDDFAEATIAAPHDLEVYGKIMDEINCIVGRYGGNCDECGPVEPGHVPFADLFHPPPPCRFDRN
jgi:hypothetical protein